MACFNCTRQIFNHFYVVVNHKDNFLHKPYVIFLLFSLISQIAQTKFDWQTYWLLLIPFLNHANKLSYLVFTSSYSICSFVFRSWPSNKNLQFQNQNGYWHVDASPTNIHFFNIQTYAYISQTFIKSETSYN